MKNFIRVSLENFVGDARSSSRGAVWDGGVPNTEEAQSGYIDTRIALSAYCKPNPMDIYMRRIGWDAPMSKSYIRDMQIRALSNSDCKPHTSTANDRAAGPAKFSGDGAGPEKISALFDKDQQV